MEHRLLPHGPYDSRLALCAGQGPRGRQHIHTHAHAHTAYTHTRAIHFEYGPRSGRSRSMRLCSHIGGASTRSSKSSTRTRAAPSYPVHTQGGWQASEWLGPARADTRSMPSLAQDVAELDTGTFPPAIVKISAKSSFIVCAPTLYLRPDLT